MTKYKDNKEYLELVSDILQNKEFNKLKYNKHHGDNRYEHCLRVSYYSYKIAKKLKLNIKEVSRAGLLHDFFLDNYKDESFKYKIKMLFEHPKCAYLNSIKYFDLNEIQKNIILSHMFPFGKVLPKYKESILIDMVDNIMCIYERIYSFSKQVISLFKKIIYTE